MSNKYPGSIITSGANAGYSVAFDGNGDTLNLGAQTAFSLGTGDFTIECWINLSAISANYQGIFDFRPTTTNGLYPAVFLFGSTSTPYLYYLVNNSAVITGTTYLKANTWYHVALCRSGTSTRLFLNGVQEGSTYTDSNNYIVGSSRPIFGGNGYAADSYLNGYISNLRVIKGTALYTAAFTPPTQLFNVPGTSLLTCNSPAIIDQSPNAFAITVNGNAAASTFTPFTGYTAYNPALGASTPGVWTVSEALEARQTRRWNMYDPYFNLTTLLLHGNGTNGAQNNTFLDSSSNNFTITRNGNTTQGTFTPFSQTGWGNYFDGSSYISVPNSTALDLPADFTIELWWYPQSLSGTQSLIGKWLAGQYAWLIQATSSTLTIVLGTGGGSVATLSNSWSPTANNWYHIAITRSGSSVRAFVNGVQVGTTQTSSNNCTSTAATGIGANPDGGVEKSTGYISNVRVTKGAALYVSNFTPSASPLTTSVSSGTVSLLTCQSNRFVDNSSNALAVSIVTGTPSVQAFSPFYPVVAYTPQAQGGSGYFDGSGDYLTAPSNAAFAVGTVFTFEFWVYPTVTLSSTNFFTANVSQGFQVGFENSSSWGLGAYLVSWELTTSTLPRTNQWNHIVVARSGTGTNQTSIFLNGARVANGTSTRAFSTAADASIGAAGAGNGIFQGGYFAGMRLIKGTDVYGVGNTSITIPTAPPTAITNTVFLLNFTNAGIIDSTGDNVLETVGNAQISTVQSKFGGSSLYFDGNGDYLFQGAGLLPYTFGTGDFTIEFWLYLNSVSVDQMLIDMRPASTQGAYPAFYFKDSDNTINWYVSTADRITSSALSISTWYHVAVCRSGTSTRMFLNGTQTGSTYSDSNNYLCSRVVIGAQSFTLGSIPLNAYIDDFRISLYARYTSTFTPQTSQWQDQ